MGNSLGNGITIQKKMPILCVKYFFKHLFKQGNLF